MEIIISDQNLLTLSNMQTTVSVTVTENSVPTDPTSLQFTLMDLAATVITEDTWPAPASRIVRDSVGVFHVVLGNQDPNTETNNTGEYLIYWHITPNSTSDVFQKLKVISARTASFIPEFKLLIDKSRKLVDASVDNYLGYTNGQLVSYLEGGLGTINAYQPSVVFSMENYPLEQKQLLLDAGLVTGVMSQQLYAVDTDIPNYNDQGVSFVINHQPQLASFLNQVTQRLDKLIPMMKLQYINSGAVHTQMGPSYRLNVLLEAAPTGALFRNVMFVSRH
jgi:hypothetical protein